MIKRDFTTWDFVKQAPKEICGNTMIGGGYACTITNYSNWTLGGGLSSTITNVNGYSNIGQNNIVLGNGITVATGVSDTTFVQNLNVGGRIDSPPIEGQVRAVMEDGYWATQVFNTSLDAVTPNNPSGDEWVTISRTDSMVTVDGISTRPKRHITWTGYFFSKLMLWLKKFKS
jgi:hypothetical protein